jgi:glycosyltransferase involved in cell wall biosynthesis
VGRAHRSVCRRPGRMNRLAVIHYPFFGGPHNQALRLSRPLRARGIETTVLLPAEPGNAGMRLRKAGIDVVELPLSRLRARFDPSLQARFVGGFIADVRRIRNLIRERRIDLVEIAGLVNTQGAVAARLEGVPVVWQLLDTRAPMSLRRLLMPVVLRFSDSVMSTGRAVAKVHPGTEALNGRLVSFFPPVDVAAFCPNPERRAAVRQELGIPSEAFVAGTVANLTPQKGVEYLVEAADRVRSAEPSVRFAIFGRVMETQREYEHSIRAAAKLADVLIADPGERVADHLQVLDVFLQTAGPRSEGISTTVLEAMATGIPVVATDVGALSEAVVNGVTGIIVQPLDVDGIADAVIRLARDPNLRASIGALSRTRAVRMFDAELCADAHVRAYECAFEHARQRESA